MTASAQPVSGDLQPNQGIDVNPYFRKVILKATQNSAVKSGVQKHGMRLGAARFVAGETLDEAVGHLRALNEKGLKANTTLLGEGIRNAGEAAVVVDKYLAILDRIAAEKLNVNIALKLTHLGLDIEEDLAYRNVERIIAHAATLGNFIRLDMEESQRVDATLRIYRRLRAAGHDNTGTVLQSYLYRTADDLAGLLDLKPNLRLVKGAYLEPETVAYPKKSDVDRQYIKLAEHMLNECSFAAIATHDTRIIDQVINYTERNGIPRDRFQFQMLYGISTSLQVELARRGYSVLIATPHGPDWYYYLMRRLAERPANALFFAKNVIKR